MTLYDMLQTTGTEPILSALTGPTAQLNLSLFGSLYRERAPVELWGQTMQINTAQT